MRITKVNRIVPVGGTAMTVVVRALGTAEARALEALEALEVLEVLVAQVDRGAPDVKAEAQDHRVAARAAIAGRKAVPDVMMIDGTQPIGIARRTKRQRLPKSV